MTSTVLANGSLARTGMLLTEGGVAGGLQEFHVFSQIREPLRERLATALFSQLSLAAVNGVGTGRLMKKEEYLKIAAQSQFELTGLTHQFRRCMQGVVAAGVHVLALSPFEDQEPARWQVALNLFEKLPLGEIGHIRPMAIEMLTTASPDQVRLHYVQAAWEACLSSGTQFIELMENLYEMMAAGWSEFVGEGGARLVYCRRPTNAGTGWRQASRSPSRLATHSFFEDASAFVLRNIELLNVRPISFSTVWARAPYRIMTMLKTTPEWLRSEISGFSGTAVRIGHGVMNPNDGASLTQEGPTYLNCSAVLLAERFVLGTWDEKEDPSLLQTYFGIWR